MALAIASGVQNEAASPLDGVEVTSPLVEAFAFLDFEDFADDPVVAGFEDEAPCPLPPGALFSFGCALARRSGVQYESASFADCDDELVTVCGGPGAEAFCFAFRARCFDTLRSVAFALAWTAFPPEASGFGLAFGVAAGAASGERAR